MLHQCIANYDSCDVLRGGVLYTDYMGGSLQMHMAGFHPNWITKALLFLAFDYPFKQLQLKKVFALVPEWNVLSRNMCQRLGFIIEYRTDDVFNRVDGVDGMYLLSMRKEACKWLEMEKPIIDQAPPERTNSITRQLSIVDHTQMTRQ